MKKTHTEIKECFDLLQQLVNGNYIFAVDLARELKVSKSELMRYVNNNDGLFKTKYGIKSNKLLIMSILKSAEKKSEKN